jgi:RNA polymerase sigma-70 factor (ECF subfamily)
MGSTTPTDLTDTDLVSAAREGDASALGLLLLRHRPSLLAVAASLLGYGPDAEDAVQEASMVALRRIGDLRDPEAAGPWLRTVVRNACRMRLRMKTPDPLGDEVGALPSAEPDPGELLERSALRDWVWQAIDELSPPLRLVVMLRYFTAVTEYKDIARACGIPVGTVRSRLSEARGKLARGLTSSAEAAYGDVSALAARRRAEAVAMIDSFEHGTVARMAGELWLPTVEFVWGSGGKRTLGREYPVRSIERDLADGVRFRLTNVVAGDDLAIWESDLLSPPEDPNHCPPGVLWVMQLDEGRVERARIMHPEHRSDPAEADCPGNAPAAYGPVLV